MAMYNLNLLSDHDVSKDREKGEDRGECRFPIDHEEGNMIHLESIGEVSNTTTTFICVGDDDYFVTAVDELRGKLIDMALDSTWLGEEEVADHGNIVGHLEYAWMGDGCDEAGSHSYDGQQHRGIHLSASAPRSSGG